jgi:hypothetical protein
VRSTSAKTADFNARSGTHSLVPVVPGLQFSESVDMQTRFLTSNVVPRKAVLEDPFPVEIEDKYFIFVKSSFTLGIKDAL